LSVTMRDKRAQRFFLSAFDAQFHARNHCTNHAGNEARS
jgi:hypothetical protein